MNVIHLLLLLLHLTPILTSPRRREEIVRAYALNPAEINNIYFNPKGINHQRDVAPQPLIRPDVPVEETVREVEELIRKDPKLPRLTRGEIIEIIENITKDGNGDSGGLVKNHRDEGKRALMVVMPFTAGSAQGDDIKELYTRTPVTRIIGAEEHRDGEKVKNKMKKPPRKWEINLENEILTNTKGTNDIPKFQYLPQTNYLPVIKASSTTESMIQDKLSTKRRRPYGSQYVEQPTTSKVRVHPSLGTSVTPLPYSHQITTTVHNYKQLSDTKMPMTTTKVTFKPEKKYANHKYEGSVTSGIHVMAPPYFLTMKDDGYSSPYVVQMHRPQMQPEVTIEEVKITPDMYGDTPKPKPKITSKVTTPKPNLAVESTVEEVKLSPEIIMYGGVSKEPKLPHSITKIVPQSTAIPLSSPPSTTVPIKTTDKNLVNQIEGDGYEDQQFLIKDVSSTAEKTNNKNHQSPSDASSILNEMSIPDQYKGAIQGLDLLITPEDPKIPFTHQVLKPIHPDVSKLSSTTTPLPDISNVANNLSPEMKDLLMSFGLINGPKKSELTTTEEIPYIQNAQIKPESYVRFKPLPIKSPGRNDMEELLSRFGLGRSSFRSQKSIAYDKSKKTLKKASEFDLDAVPDSLKSVVYNLGIKEKNIRMVTSEDKHVFKPADQLSNLHENTTEEELKKLGKLLDMIRELEQMKGNITAESLKDFDTETLKELIENFNGNVVVPLDEKDTVLNPEKFEYNITKKGYKRDDESQTTTELEEVVTVTPSFMDLMDTVSRSFETSTSGNEASFVAVSNEDSTEASGVEAEASGIEAGASGAEADASGVEVGASGIEAEVSGVEAESSSDESKTSSLEDLEASFGGMIQTTSTTEEPTTTTTPRTGFYYLLDWNTFLELDNQNGKRVNLRFQPHAGNPQYFRSVTVP